MIFKRARPEWQIAEPQTGRAVSPEASVPARTPAAAPFDPERAARIERLENLLRRPGPLAFTATFLFEGVSGEFRSFATRLGAHIARTGVIPQVWGGAAYLNPDNGGYAPVQMAFNFSSGLDKDDESIIRHYSVSIYTKRPGGRSGLGEFHREDVPVDLSRGSERQGFHDAREVLLRGLRISGLQDGYAMKVAADEVIGQWKEVFAAVESRARGDYAVWEMQLGLGYFQQSTDEEIVVDEIYSQSAFDYENVRSFLSNSPAYASSVPRLRLQVSDSNPITGAFWAIQKFDGQWSVEVVAADGTRTHDLTPTAEDVYSHVYWAAHRHVDSQDVEVSLAKAVFARDLLSQVEDAFAEHEDRIQGRQGAAAL